MRWRGGVVGRGLGEKEGCMDAIDWVAVGRLIAVLVLVAAAWVAGEGWRR